MPASWQRQAEGTEDGLRGEDGFVGITALAGPATVERACRADMDPLGRVHGASPQISWVEVQGLRACRIVPTANAAKQGAYAGLIVQLPKPHNPPGPDGSYRHEYPYLVVWTDPRRLGMIERSLGFVSHGVDQ